MSTFSKIIHPNLLKGNIFKSLFCFALPILISYIFQQLYNAVDTIIVGHYLKEQSLAAIGAAGSLYELVVGFGVGFGSGMGLVVARYFGAKDETRLKKGVASSFIITIFVTLIIMLITHFTLEPLLRFLRTPESIIKETLSYISIICLCCGAMFAFNLFSGLLRAIGNSFVPLLFLIISSILNIFLDLTFIIKFNMGIKGAAVATVIAQSVCAILCFIYILVKARILIPSIRQKHFAVEGRIYKELTAQGLSMACMSSIVSSGSLILQSAINSFGTLIIAAHVSTRKIFSITSIPLITFAVANATFVSQNYGAGNLDRIRKGVRISCLTTTIWSLFLCVSMPFVLKYLLIFISGSTEPELLNYGTKYLLFAYPFFVILGVLVVLRNALQGLDCKILPLVSSIMELCGKILFTVLIIPHMGIWGIIICEPLIWCVMTANLIHAYIRRIKQVTKELSSKTNNPVLQN